LGDNSTRIATTAYVDAEIANDAPTKTGGGASGTWGIAISGNAATATSLSTDRTNWSTNGTIDDVVGQLAWKNYGNNHTIFDASQSTSPSGGGVNNTNAAVAWAATYPTLMGWNGVSTYGVRVDSARVADGVSSAAGAVGSYAFLNNPSNTAARAAGTTVAGSSLQYSAAGNAGPNGQFSNNWISASGTPSGTWQLMGANTVNGTYKHSSLYLRIS
jgi:hypothetical protein